MKKLSPQEEDAMQILWQSKGGFIKDVLDLLPEPKVPYTTLASTIKNLEKKKYLKAVRLGNSYRYEPLIAEEDYKKAFVGNFVNEYFQNSYKELVSFFAKDEKISPEELQEIVDMIQNTKK
jgi:BlaI family penicillinase repressor